MPAALPDWPLIEAVAETSLPVVISTGGLKIREIDNLVIFGEHHAVDFALMHCVSIYPTPPQACSLQNIAMLRKRHPEVWVGWSTHEDPDAIAPIQMATAYGAVIFERHIGVATETFKLNGYSSSPAQTDRWLEAWKMAQALAGSYERCKPPEQKATALRGLQRGSSPGDR